jgi:bifunctional non-homologous end joining protein LigD
MARRDSPGVRLITRHGNDFTARFPLAVEAVSVLSAKSFLIDGEAIVTNERGLAVFDLIRHQRHGDDALLLAFDLIELDGEDLRRTPIEQRKRILAKLARRPHAGIVVNEIFEGDGDILFAHACKLGCEGIVSKRLGSLYRSGRSPLWLKVKNPKAPAVKREAEEDWGKKGRDARAQMDKSEADPGATFLSRLSTVTTVTVPPRSSRTRSASSPMT